MISRALKAAALVLASMLVLTACGGDSTDDSDPSTEEDAMYCELIDPQTVEPIVGSNEIKDFGGPVAKTDTRTIKCNLYDADKREDRMAVYEYEVSSQALPKERDEVSAAMAKHTQEDTDHYVALDADGDDLGYAWFTGDTAAANLLTDTRKISVTAPATADQAATYVPIVLKVAQEIDRNLEAWDAEHTS